MSDSPIEVVGQWMQNLLDPDVINSVVAPDATYVSLNTENPEDGSWIVQTEAGAEPFQV